MRTNPLMQELLRAAARNQGGLAWAESMQPLREFESSIASRLSSHAHEAREGEHATIFCQRVFIPSSLYAC